MMAMFHIKKKKITKNSLNHSFQSFYSKQSNKAAMKITQLVNSTVTKRMTIPTDFTQFGR